MAGLHNIQSIERDENFGDIAILHLTFAILLKSENWISAEWDTQIPRARAAVRRVLQSGRRQVDSGRRQDQSLGLLFL